MNLKLTVSITIEYLMFSPFFTELIQDNLKAELPIYLSKALIRVTELPMYLSNARSVSTDVLK